MTMNCLGIFLKKEDVKADVEVPKEQQKNWDILNNNSNEKTTMRALNKSSTTKQEGGTSQNSQIGVNKIITPSIPNEFNISQRSCIKIVEKKEKGKITHAIVTARKSRCGGKVGAENSFLVYKENGLKGIKIEYKGNTITFKIPNKGKRISDNALLFPTRFQSLLKELFPDIVDFSETNSVFVKGCFNSYLKGEVKVKFRRKDIKITPDFSEKFFKSFVKKLTALFNYTAKNAIAKKLLALFKIKPPTIDAYFYLDNNEVKATFTNDIKNIKKMLQEQRDECDNLGLNDEDFDRKLYHNYSDLGGFLENQNENKKCDDKRDLADKRPEKPSTNISINIPSIPNNKHSASGSSSATIGFTNSSASFTFSDNNNRQLLETISQGSLVDPSSKLAPT